MTAPCSCAPVIGFRFAMNTPLHIARVNCGSNAGTSTAEEEERRFLVVGRTSRTDCRLGKSTTVKMNVTER